MRIIVLFNLKPGTDAGEYENWARTRDLPTVRAMPSVDDLVALRTTGLLGADGTPPYAYVQIIEVADMEGFGTDFASEAAEAVKREFGDWAEAPVYMLTEELGLG